MTIPFTDILTTEAELRELLGVPSEVVKRKSIRHLDHNCRNFIAMSPLLFLSTSDEHGACDVSPRGDGPGAVLVLDDGHLVIPERPGNRRFDSLRNILVNPNAGLIFIIPGLEETLRVNGQAYVIKDEEILDRMKARDKRPTLGIGVKVEECYMHCAKAFKRSQIWDSGSWPEDSSLPSVPRIIAEHVNAAEFTVEVVRQGIEESYAKRLY
ncbi:pyridoxamine 5'-phosphate oxidase family protein [Paenibacillus sp. MMS20-IR301]|uniref:pyridoxamine 5'-phosphate oxidase family protein n=1 Tax=Paenibacillus sp. MMS20-IR301 TaxID=2895946 RepID=UPI0028E84771|nr:pyridoxamine 5'-phosphate oxidase family protein [Paenibacillus sp. MMS20-IR301]WNS44695.1 pyridoxamine 5'-phosphate oxidase family protein [Paenibacillus sp. MMS20-IR301]